jgi:simple sugar transport system permease protein
VVGGNPRTAQLVGLPASGLILAACGIGGACAGVAGAVEVAAVHTNANASLIAGYGYAGILVSFIARHNPVAVIPVAILFGGFGAAGSLLQRRLGLPDASVLVLQGMAFVLILASEGLRMIDWQTLLKNRMPRAVQPRMTKEAA